MNELLNETVVEETMDNAVEVTENISKKGIAGVAVKAAIGLAVVLVVRTVVKKVIKPKLEARKAMKNCDDIEETEEVA